MIFSSYSLVMSIILFTILSFIGGFAIRYTEWKTLKLFGFISLLAIIRCFIPIEFVGSIVLRSKNIYPFFYKLMQKEVVNGIDIGNILTSIWLIGSTVYLILLIRVLYIQWRFVQQYALPKDHPIYNIVNKVTEKLGFSYRGKIVISPNVSTAYMVGLMKPNIIFPRALETLSEEKLTYIFDHELCHFKEKDLWIKLGMQVVCCLFWWNPVVYFLKKSIDRGLEIRCDKRVCAMLGNDKIAEYMETLILVAKNMKNQKVFFAAGYSENKNKNELLYRFEQIAGKKQNKIPSFIMPMIAIIVSILFVGSYGVILQPHKDAPAVEYEVFISTKNENDNTFILRRALGQLEYYKNEKFIEYLTEDMLLKEPYCSTVIYEAY